MARAKRSASQGVAGVGRSELVQWNEGCGRGAPAPSPLEEIVIVGCLHDLSRKRRVVARPVRLDRRHSRMRGLGSGSGRHGRDLTRLEAADKRRASDAD
jgi:hypothetical protein